MSTHDFYHQNSHSLKGIGKKSTEYSLEKTSEQDQPEKEGKGRDKQCSSKARRVTSLMRNPLNNV